MTETSEVYKTKTARTLILERLGEAAGPLAIHELSIKGHSENALATEMSIMAKDGLVAGRYRQRARYKEWTPLSKGWPAS